MTDDCASSALYFILMTSMRRFVVLVLPAEEEEAIIALFALSLALPSLHLKNTSPDQITDIHYSS